MEQLKKVKVTADLTGYRNKVLGLPIKDYRALQAGKDAMIPADLIKKFKCFKEVTNGN